MVGRSCQADSTGLMPTVNFRSKYTSGTREGFWSSKESAITKGKHEGQRCSMSQGYTEAGPSANVNKGIEGL